MKTELELLTADFGDTPTLKISAFTPRDIFSLACLFMKINDKQLRVVHSATGDGKGMFLRLPMVHDVSTGPEDKKENITERRPD